MKRNLLGIALIISFLIVDNQSVAQKTDKFDQQEELGKISWYRNYDDAVKEAKRQNKLIFILFQEVPGCLTCRNYGNNVLSHPLLVDIIENEFVPLVIFNNKNGYDKKILKLYKEPSWNNPVIRIVDAKGKDIIKRHSGDYSLSGISNQIRIALTMSKNGLIEYADILTQELGNEKNDNDEAYYSMYCFWTGEAKLGQANGILSSTPGFMNGKEVVKIKYDKKRFSKTELTKIAKKNKFTIEKNITKFRVDKDEQYYLKNSLYKYLPLSSIQRTKINSALAHDVNPDKFLSPTQLKWKLKLLKGSSSNEVLYTQNVIDAWTRFNTNHP